VGRLTDRDLLERKQLMFDVLSLFGVKVDTVDADHITLDVVQLRLELDVVWNITRRYHFNFRLLLELGAIK